MSKDHPSPRYQAKLEQEEHKLLDIRMQHEISRLELQEHWTSHELNSVIRHIRDIPEAPVPDGFVAAAMQRWRRTRLAFSPPATPSPLSFTRWLRIVTSQGLWPALLLGLSFYAAAYALLQWNEEMHPLLILSVIGCIPLFAVTLNTARHALCGMGELTRSLRISLHRYVLTRLLLAAATALLVNSCITLVLIAAGVPIQPGRFILLWSIPLLLNTAASLQLSARIRNFRQLAVSLSVLPCIWLTVLVGDPVQRFLTTLPLPFLMLASAASLVLLALAAKGQARHIQQGGMILEA
ncbi:hypothetical protein [Paenibacillus tepidiphilus]|uniref:hypothetical protein n=1 Tax=Paenibacillus tepidiphilus TaxID=2608683 RepID=UPI00123894B8|nr:hypothetical protein [Paenibacillus tepidiphilus]